MQFHEKYPFCSSLVGLGIIGGISYGGYKLWNLIDEYREGKKKDEKKIDGKAWAKTIRGEVKKEVEALAKIHGKVPTLAVVLVGGRKDSATYVRMKERACKECGITSVQKLLKEDVTEAEVIKVVKELNDDPNVHGILVQLPLPKQVNEKKVLDLISLKKDVDGFHANNIGKLAMKGRNPLFIPCTPRGCIELLKREKIPISGKRAVIIGRSNIVGIPVSFLLLHENATITIVHSRTKNSEKIVRKADIVVACCGQTQMVKKEWLKKGCTVIDVGINSLEDKTRKRGYRLVGDVDFNDAVKRCGRITPVPGGVGPMTVACLMQNVVEGFKLQIKK